MKKYGEKTTNACHDTRWEILTYRYTG